MWKRALLLAIVLGVAAAAWWSGAFELVRDLDKVRALLASWGPWAYVLYVVSFSVLQPLGVVALVWVVPAGFLWSFPVAFALSLAGAAGAVSFGFLFARYLARDWVAARLSERFRRYDDRLAANGLGAVIVLRLVFLLSSPTHWLLGLSKVSYGAAVLGTVIGIAPAIALIVYFDAVALHWLEAHASMSGWVIGAVLAVALIARYFILRRSRRMTAPD